MSPQPPHSHSPSRGASGVRRDPATYLATATHHTVLTTLKGRVDEVRVEENDMAGVWDGGQGFQANNIDVNGSVGFMVANVLRGLKRNLELLKGR